MSHQDHEQTPEEKAEGLRQSKINTRRFFAIVAFVFIISAGLVAIGIYGA